MQISKLFTNPSRLCYNDYNIKILSHDSSVMMMNIWGSVPFFAVLCTVLRIHDILVWIRIRGSMPLTAGSGSGCGSGSPSIFIIDLQDANKKITF
jgi:hypothetical protein